MRIENDKRTESIDSKGSVNFKQISTSLKNDSVSIEIEAKGWEFFNGKTSETISLNGTSTIVKVQLDNSLCCVFGSVRDEANKYLTKVTVSIEGVFTETDENGRFSLEIPLEKQKEVQTLTVYKQGYKLWEARISPASKKDIKVQLHQ